MLYAPVDGGVICNLCARKCVVQNGKSGFCRVRKNIDNKLVTEVYGATTLNYVDAIEKKALFHFNPGSYTFSFGTSSCNFRCKFCINFMLSREVETSHLEILSPKEIVNRAKKSDSQSISFTYNEPTVFFEYAYDTARLAHEDGLFTTMLTNGYMTPEAVKEIAPYLDAVAVDIKGAASSEFYKKLCDVPDVQPIFDCLQEIHKNKIHLEVTDLVMLKHGDSRENIRKLAAWMHDNLGPDIPLHLLIFRQQCTFKHDVLPNHVFDELYDMVRKEGLNFVYTPVRRDTYCPSCGELLITRTTCCRSCWDVTPKIAPNNACPKCGQRIPLVGKFYDFEGEKDLQASAINGDITSMFYWGYEG